MNIEAIKELAKRGYTKTEIANELNISRGWLHKLTKRHGIECETRRAKKPIHWTQDKLDELESLKRQGYTWRKVAHIMGESPESCQTMASKTGISRRLNDEIARR